MIGAELFMALEKRVNMQVDNTNETRRAVMVQAIYGLVALMAAAVGLPGLLYLTSRPKNLKPNRWVDAGDISNLTPDSPTEVSFRRNRVDGWRIHSEKEVAWVIKNRDSSITAYLPWCTHLGCAYSWEPLRSQFVCPCHGSSFAKTGEVMSGPAPRPLDRYDVKLEGNRLWLGAPEKAGV
jgi:menaquinol-cytochrome c reductase iron-sulfur subunit